MEKICFIDLETTGVDKTKNGIWQIAGRIRIDGEERERFNWRMKPFPGQIVAAKALEVGHVTIEELRTFDEPRLVFSQMSEMLGRYVDKYDRSDKFFFVAYNAQFDMDFLREWFANNGDKYFGSWFWFPYIDVMQLAGFCLARRRHELPNFKLETVLEWLGLPLVGAHDAEMDIDGTIRAFDHFVERGLVMEQADLQADGTLVAA